MVTILNAFRAALIGCLPLLFAAACVQTDAGGPVPVAASPDFETASGDPLSAAQLRNFVAAEMSALDMPGLTIAIFDDGRIVYEDALGRANVATGVPVDSDTYRATGETGWGLGIAIEPTPYGTRYEHGGNNGEFQSGYMIFPERRMGFVFMTNSDRGAEFGRRLEAYLTDQTRLPAN